jgi:hypothetical protein
MQLYEFKEVEVPEDATRKQDLSDRLMAFGISLCDYWKSRVCMFLILALLVPFFTCMHACLHACRVKELPKKRAATVFDSPDVRSSPRHAVRPAEEATEQVTPQSLF